jgi:outer membrane protease
MFVCALAALSHPALHAEDKPFKGSVEVLTAAFFGGMNEYVFEKDRKHEVSRLEWDENFVPYIDLRGQFEFWDFFTCLSLITSIPVKSGRMRDYDYTIPNSSAVSHYSEHDALFDKHLEIFPEIGWGRHIGNWYFAASAGFLYRNRKWTASGGWTQYPSVDGEAWNDSVPKEQQAGTIITYEEAFWTPVITLYADFTITKSFTIGLASGWYPYLDITTVDTHILRSIQFFDHMQGGWGTTVDLSLTWQPANTESVAFLFGMGYEGIFPQRGTTSTGGIGSDIWLGVSPSVESYITSNLFWVNAGICLYPEKFFTDTPNYRRY